MARSILRDLPTGSDELIEESLVSVGHQEVDASIVSGRDESAKFFRPASEEENHESGLIQLGEDGLGKSEVTGQPDDSGGPEAIPGEVQGGRRRSLGLPGGWYLEAWQATRSSIAGRTISRGLPWGLACPA